MIKETSCPGFTQSELASRLHVSLCCPEPPVTVTKTLSDTVSPISLRHSMPYVFVPVIPTVDIATLEAEDGLDLFNQSPVLKQLVKVPSEGDGLQERMKLDFVDGIVRESCPSAFISIPEVPSCIDGVTLILQVPNEDPFDNVTVFSPVLV